MSMSNIKEFNDLDGLLTEIKTRKKENYYFLWEFLNEIDSHFDELLILLEKEWNLLLLKFIHKTSLKLPKISDIYYAAYNFENEIYDFYWKEIEWNKAYTLRLHLDKKNYFPKRKLGQPSIKEKKDFIFTEIKWDWNIKVQVWPIHAWIISPGHFRFTCDWENTLNLDIQLGWKHRWVEEYFTTENNLDKLLDASEDIVWDSRIAYSINFAKIIEEATNTKISEKIKQDRVILLELERIYNHLWTIWAMLNDVWQWFLLNWFSSIREEFLCLFDDIFKSRTLKWVIWIWKNNIELDDNKYKLIIKTIDNIFVRFNELYVLWRDSAWIYDRFKETWIVKKQTAYSHWALWIWAKASWIYKDSRIYDDYYKNIKLEEIIWEQWDVFDRYTVRAKEILQSFKIIKNIANKNIKNKEKWGDKNIISDKKLNDWYYISQTEWQRWEVLMLAKIVDNKISYFKIKDPSFVNWTLLEYSVLNNIIADFPICNKSFDLSYSWFDL